MTDIKLHPLDIEFEQLLDVAKPYLDKISSVTGLNPLSFQFGSILVLTLNRSTNLYKIL